MAGCASVTGSPRASRPQNPALLTASVAGTVAEGMTPDLMRAFFATGDGRATLARDGQAGSVRVLETRRVGDALYMLVEDRSPNSVPDTEPRYWRGVFPLNGHLVTLSILSFSGRPLSRDAGLATLRAFHLRVLQASGGAPAPAAETPGARSEPVPAAAQTAPPGLPGLLGRLLR